MQRIVIAGAGSAIAQEVAKIYAGEQASFFLIDRNEDLLPAVAHDLGVRGARHVEAVTADLTAFDQHAALLRRAVEALGGIDVVLIAHGTLPNQKECEESWEKTRQALEVNQLSIMSFMMAAAEVMAEGDKAAKKTIAVISSVAGDRGRQSNYVYGTAKGAIAIFASGLRNRLVKSGIHVLTIKPGFVDTPMTAAFKKGILWAKPAVVARGIVRAIERQPRLWRGQRDIVYIPWFWRYIMFVINNIPERFFKRMSL